MRIECDISVVVISRVEKVLLVSSSWMSRMRREQVRTCVKEVTSEVLVERKLLEFRKGVD